MDDSIIETAALKALDKYGKLQDEKVELEKRIAEVEQEMAMLRPKIAALTDLIYDEPPVDSPLGQFLLQLEKMGLTDAIREVLKASNDFMTPVDVRNALIKMGYDIKKYGNILASIHTILKRLLDAGELWFSLRDKDGKVGYKWDASRHTGARDKGKEAMLDPFIGGGSLPAKSAPHKTDIVLANPPYATGKKTNLGVKRRRNKR